MDEATDSHWQNNCLIRHLYCDNLNPIPTHPHERRAEYPSRAGVPTAGQADCEGEWLRTLPKALGRVCAAG